MPDNDGGAPEVGPTMESLEVLRIKAGGRERIADHVVCERTLAVIVGDATVARMQYLPGQERELAAGFLASEGLRAQGPVQIETCELEADLVKVRVLGRGRGQALGLPREGDHGLGLRSGAREPGG